MSSVPISAPPSVPAETGSSWLWMFPFARRLHEQFAKAALMPWFHSVSEWFERYGYEVFPRLLRETEVVRPFGSLEVGESASIAVKVTRARLVFFGLATGDWNLIHFDELFASRTRFEKPTAHGFLTAAYISSVLSSKLPGQGTVYESQSLSFKRPVYPGDEVTATAVITALESGRARVTLATEVRNQNDVVVITGEGVVRLMKPV